MATFDTSWIPDRDPSKKIAPRVNEAKFGDGYSQRVPDGINNLAETWTLAFTLRPVSQIDAIDSFLQANYNGFYWTTPRGASIKVKCTEWTPVYNHDGDAQIACVFERLFEQ